MNLISRRSLPCVLAGALAVFGAAACGDDDNGDGNNPDAGITPNIDAAPPVPFVRSGTLGITETSVTNTAGAVFGALVRIGFADETTRTVPPVAGFESSVGGCLITVYDVPAGDDPFASEPDPVGEGTVSVTGTANGPFGCAFVAARGEYVCQSATPAVAGGDAEGASLTGATGVFSLEGAAWPDSMVGMFLTISAIPGAAFPITAVSGDDLTLYGVPVDTVVASFPADTAYASYVGVGPQPGGFNFIDSETAVAISKGAGDEVGEFSVTVTPRGEGFQLLNDAENDFYLPHAIPTDAAALVKFGCDADGCGQAGAGTLAAMTINGTTTDGDLTDLGPTDMPDPVEQYATFTCSVLGNATSVQLTEAAMAVILGTNPKRIQIGVGRMSGEIVEDADGSWRAFVVAGHQHLGFTTVAPK
jgi:hypothetical protein